MNFFVFSELGSRGDVKWRNKKSPLELIPVKLFREDKKDKPFINKQLRTIKKIKKVLSSE